MPLNNAADRGGGCWKAYPVYCKQALFIERHTALLLLLKLHDWLEVHLYTSGFLCCQLDYMYIVIKTICMSGICEKQHEKILGLKYFSK